MLPLTVDGIKKLLYVRPESWGNVPLFATAEGKPMNTHAWSLRLRRYWEKLGFKISAYDLRHVFVLIFLRNGGHALALQRTLGQYGFNCYEKVCGINIARFARTTHHCLTIKFHSSEAGPYEEIEKLIFL